MSYNLLVERWIPVLWRDGKYGRVGLREALAEAAHIHGIAAGNPMDRAAILRFLLALVYWCRGNPSEADPVAGSWLPGSAFDRLDGSAACFNLLGDGERFYQYRAPGAVKDEGLAANYLLQEIPTGNNAWHFRHATDKVDGLCPAYCALGLLRLPLFATSAGRGKPPGVNSKPPLYAIPIGRSLAETLRLSWLPVPELGTPAWKKPDLQLPKAGTVPLLTGLTWVPRRVWLDDPREPCAPCVSCGHKGPLIRLTIFAPIGSTKVEEGNPARVWRDPHVLYTTSPKGEVTALRAADATGASDAAAGQWTRLVAAALRRYEEAAAVHYPDASANARLWVVGFATVQNDKYLEAVEYLLPSATLVRDLPAALAQVEQWQNATRRLTRSVARSKVQGLMTSAAIRPQAEHRAFAEVGGLLAGEEEAPGRMAGDYDSLLQALAMSLAPGITTAAIEQRGRVLNARPDPRAAPQAGSGKGPRR